VVVVVVAACTTLAIACGGRVQGGEAGDASTPIGSSPDASGVSLPVDAGLDVTASPPEDVFDFDVDHPFDGSCPSACTGGCAGGICTIACSSGTFACSGGVAPTCPSGMPCRVLCDGPSACQPASITCPTDAPCEVDCVGETSCGQASVQCPASASAPCSIECTAQSACQETTFRCGGGPCTINCNGGGVCQQSKFFCGPGPCSATCTNPAAEPNVIGCDAAASCANSCGG